MEQGNQNLETLSPDGEAVKELIEASRTNPAVLEKHPHIKEFIERTQGKAASAEGATAKPAEGATAKPAEGATTPDINIQGPLSKTNVKAGEGNFPSLDVASDFIENKFGIQKSENQLDTFFDTAQKWRKDSIGYAGASKKLNDLSANIGSLPVDLKLAVTKALNNESYRDVFSGLDLSKDVNNVSSIDLLNNYYPGQFSKEDITDMENNPATKQALNVAKQSFLNDKRVYDQQTSQVSNTRTTDIQARSDAASESVNFFKQTFPDASLDASNQVSEFLSAGDDSQVLGLFFQPNGTLRKDAAVKLSYVLFAKQELEAKDKIIQELTNSLKGSGKVSPSSLQGGEQGGQFSDTVKSKLDGLSSFVGSNPYT